MAASNLHVIDQLQGPADSLVYHALGMPFAQAASSSTTGFALVREDACVIWANAAFATLTCMRSSPVGVRLDEELDLHFRLADGEAAQALAQDNVTTLNLSQGRDDSKVTLHIAALDGETRVVVAMSDEIAPSVFGSHVAGNTMIDPLTRLGNLPQLLRQLENWPFQQEYSLLCLDVDGFGDVNESLGRADADRLLQLVADRLTRASRAGDKVYRTDGDEFVILHPTELDNENDTPPISMAERLISLFERPFRLDRQLVQVGASIGIAVKSESDSETTGSDILSRSRDALRDAQRAGGQCSRVYKRT